MTIRILINLLSNAVKFSKAGGTVDFVTNVTYKNGRARHVYTITDNGMGISEEFRKKMFMPFEQENRENVALRDGQGLGLYICKNLVDLMGGTIEVITAPGAGTEFIVRLTLPLQSGSEGEREIEDEQLSAPDFRAMRLLLVEDNEINREIALEILGAAGFTLETAVNGKEAVEKVSASAPGYYNAVLMDIQMPVMNGYEAARAIRALDDAALASIPIVAMTANAFSEDIENAKEAGMNAHVAKPIDVDKLMKTLAQILRK